ncbi:hypothetical protein TNCV_1576911 [Trichonephila clavipes]|nr:hypothetical protein TNCV_1576911 [Trichonephila clavipes]
MSQHLVDKIIPSMYRGKQRMNGRICEIDNVIEEVVDLTRQITLEVDSDDVQKLFDFHNMELIVDELIEMHEQG